MQSPTPFIKEGKGKTVLRFKRSLPLAFSLSYLAMPNTVPIERARFSGCIASVAAVGS
jgi:hypothetical protein